MITVKKSRRYALRLILIILCLSNFVGCSKNTSDAFLALGEMMDKIEDDCQIRCEILYREDASSQLIADARELAENVGEQTGMDTVAHGGAVEYLSDCFYIVLGRMEDGYTQYWYSGMKADDYVCRVYENIVALGGVSESATIAAIERFESDILPSAESGKIADDGVAFRHTGEYSIGGVFINGYELGNYTLAVEDASALELAREFRQRLASVSGEYPDIDTGKAKNGRREIVIITQSENVSSGVSIRTEREDVYVETDSIYGLSVGLDALYTRMMENVSDGVASLNLEKDILFAYSDARLKVMCFIGADSDGFMANAENMARSVEESGADVIFVCAPNSDYWKAVKVYLSDSYGFELFQINGGTIAAMYRWSSVRLDASAVDDREGLTSLKLNVYHRSAEENYTVWGFFSENGADVSALANTVTDIMKHTDDTSVAVFVSEKNVTTMLNVNADGYRTDYNLILTSKSTQYRVCVLSSDTLECYDKTAADGDFASVSVNVRFKRLPWKS